MDRAARQQLMDAQSAVAAGVADKNVKIVWGAETPKADLRSLTIHLPMLPEEVEEKTLDIMRGFVDQKTARLLYTDIDALDDRDTVVLSIGNSIEDGRCMRLLGERLLGCKLNIDAAVESCEATLKQQLEDAKAKDPKVYAVTRGILALTPLADGVPLDKVLRKFDVDEGLLALFSLIEDVVAKLPVLTTTQESMACAEAIRNRWEAFLDQPIMLPEPPEGEGDGTGGKGGKGNKNKSKKQAKQDGTEDEDGEEEESDEDSDEDTTQDKKKSKADKKQKDGEEEEEGEGEQNNTEGEQDEDGEGDDGDHSDADGEGEQDENAQGEGDGDGDDQDGDGDESDDSEDGDGDEENDGDAGDEGGEGGGNDHDDDEEEDDDEDDEESQGGDESIDSEEGTGDGKKTDRDAGENGKSGDDKKKRRKAKIKAQQKYGIERTEESLRRAADILREAAQEAGKSDVGTVLGRNVKFAADFERSSQRSRQSYLAWSELDELSDVSNIRSQLIDDLVAESRTATGYLKNRLAMDLIGRGPIWLRDKDKGRLDDRKLHRVATDDGRVFKRRLTRPRINAAVTFLMDCSQSMVRPGQKLWLAMQLAIAFTEACEMLDVPVEVLGFTTVPMGSFSTKARQLAAQAFTRLEPIKHLVVKSFDKKFAERINAFANIMCVGLRDNVDGEAILWASRRLAERREKNKHLFVLSDGQPNSVGDKAAFHQHLRGAVQRVERSGISCIGLGMLSAHVKDFYKDYVIIKELEDLLKGGYEKLSAILKSDRET